VPMRTREDAELGRKAKVSSRRSIRVARAVRAAGAVFNPPRIDLYSGERRRQRQMVCDGRDIGEPQPLARDGLRRRYCDLYLDNISRLAAR